MKKIITLSLLSAVALYATNGDNLIGFGAQSRAMGGVGIATYFGAENTLSNPALISHVKGKEIDVGVTYFAPTIKTNGSKSAADQNFIPHIAYAQEFDAAYTFGLGIYGSSGMGVDFRDSGKPSLMSARTNLVIMKITPTIAYKKDNFSFGFAPILQYGSLKLSYNAGTPVDLGASNDFGVGIKSGVAYDITPSLKMGATYQSAISMTYKDVLSVASSKFGLSIGDTLEQPAELGVGVSYDISNFNISADYKKVKWGSAKGYKDFGWVDQDVYAIGAKYEKGGTWYAVGYNHAPNPITKDFGGPTKAVMNTLNYIFFPATQEDHYTIGTGTKITEALSIDSALVYGVKNTVNSVGVTGPISVGHSETSLTVSMKYRF
jgi:long-chain fatty acid transport protein